VKNWIVRWLANIAALFAVTMFVPGIHFDGHNYLSLVIVVVGLALANAVLRPIIMFFAWPINCLTFGLLGFALNILFFWVAGSGVVPGYRVDGALPALIGSVAMGLLSGMISFFFKDRGDKDNK
jgi:putative membrane protein